MMKRVWNTLLILLVVSLPLASLLLVNQPEVANAQAPYERLAPLPTTFFPTQTNLIGYLTGYFRLGLAVAGVLAVIMIIIGGVQIMTTDSIFNRTEGKKKIQGALLGLLLAFAAYLILNTINPDLVRFRSNIGNTNIDVNITGPGSGGAGGNPAPAPQNNASQPPPNLSQPPPPGQYYCFDVSASAGSGIASGRRCFSIANANAQQNCESARVAATGLQGATISGSCFSRTQP